MSSLPSSSRLAVSSFPLLSHPSSLVVSCAVSFCSSLVVSFRPRPVLRLVHRPACCRLVLRFVPRSVPRSSVVSSVGSSHSSFLAVLPPRAPFRLAHRSSSCFVVVSSPRLVLHLVPSSFRFPSRRSFRRFPRRLVSSPRFLDTMGGAFFSFDSGRGKQAREQAACGRWIRAGGWQASRRGMAWDRQIRGRPAHPIRRAGRWAYRFFHARGRGCFVPRPLPFVLVIGSRST